MADFETSPAFALGGLEAFEQVEEGQRGCRVGLWLLGESAEDSVGGPAFVGVGSFENSSAGAYNVCQTGVGTVSCVCCILNGPFVSMASGAMLCHSFCGVSGGAVSAATRCGGGAG